MRSFAVAWLLVVGCAESPARHGNAALGVAAFAARSTPIALELVGTDPAGGVRARLQLRTGMVTPEGWDAPTLGRELRFEILGEVHPPFASAGLGSLELPLTADPYLNTFVLDPFVADALRRRGIAFADRARVDAPEVRFAAGCAANTLTFAAPCNGYGAGSTCQDFWGYWNGHEMWAQKVVCADPAQTRAERICAYGGATTPCGIAGPNGCAVCGPAGSGGWTECSGDTCRFSNSGGGGGGPDTCNGTACQFTCATDDDCCSCGGYCGEFGDCVY